jgi:hypothetical protein
MLYVVLRLGYIVAVVDFKTVRAKEQDGRRPVLVRIDLSSRPTLCLCRVEEESTVSRRRCLWLGPHKDEHCCRTCSLITFPLVCTCFYVCAYNIKMFAQRAAFERTSKKMFGNVVFCVDVTDTNLL